MDTTIGSSTAAIEEAAEFSPFAARVWITAVELALVVVGMRDRLRCPDCRKVGTYKPHGSLITERGGRPVARWLCKWCGFYRGPEKTILRATIRDFVWRVPILLGEELDTPKTRLERDAVAHGEKRPPDPWFG